MRKTYLHPFLLTVLLGGMGPFASLLPAEEKVALVVGNREYANANDLNNAVNDSRAISKMLRGLGFKVIAIEDATIDEFYEGLDEFSREAAKARMGLFYFAGHGIEVENRNYLVPVDAELERQSQLRTQVVSVDTILNEMKSVKLPAKMLILDCCRDNPLTRSWLSTRSSGSGLAGIQDHLLPEATMILFAAAPGQTALDGSGSNSPFTKALISELARPGRNALDSFYAVSDFVVKETASRQEPWVKVDGAGRTFRMFSLGRGVNEKPQTAVPAPVPAPEKPMTNRPTSKPAANSSGMRIVPDQYATIQEAVGAAQPGEIVFIKNGIYSEFVDIYQKERIEIRGESRTGTILRMPFEADWGSVLLQARESKKCQVSNLTLEFPAGGLSTKRPDEINGPNCLALVSGEGFEFSDCSLRGGNEISGVAGLKGFVRMSGCSIEKCDVFGFGVAGAAASAEVLNSSISECGRLGISFENGASGKAEGNTVENCGDTGIVIVGKGSSAELSGNNCLNNKHAGIVFQVGTGGLAENNRCEGNLIGIAVTGAGSNPELRMNQCQGNQNGIEVFDGASPLVVQNQCHRNKGSGILAYGANTKPRIVSNSCTYNGNMGIGVEAKTYPAQFDGNTAEGNSGGDIDRRARTQ